MKGKGKKEKDTDSDDCPLQFLDFIQIDHTKHCPRFTSVLQRSEDEGIGFEDLDVLQLELEMLLVSVVKRQSQLQTETDALINWHDPKRRDKKSPIKSQHDTVGKRSKQQTEEKPNKRFKESSASGVSPGKSHSRPHKVKNMPVRFTETEYTDVHRAVVSKKVPIKNDIPDQFWQFIEPYCSPITSEHIKTIGEIIKSYENDGEYYKVPNLGKNYALKWEHEDLLDSRKEGSKHVLSAADKKKGLSASNSSREGSSATHSSGKSSKKGAKETSEASFGALTQRLVSCLIEENLLSSTMEPKSVDSESAKGNNGAENGNIFKSLNIGNTAQLERRIRKELEEHGILNMDDILTNTDHVSGDHDEILHELKRCQSELKSVSAKNLTHLKRLQTMAKKEITKQEIGKKLANADTEVMEAYRKILSVKQKKRSPTKKEKEHAWKVIKERDNILKLIS